MNIIYVSQLCNGFQLCIVNTSVYSCVISNGYAISILLSLLCLMLYNANDGLLITKEMLMMGDIFLI